MIVGISKRFNNQGMKVQVNRAFKSYSFFQPPLPSKKEEQSRRLIQVYRGASIPYFEINNPFFCCHLFFEEHLNPSSGSTKW